MKIVECVPNFSEGRDDKIIAAIAEAIRSNGTRLVSVDSGESTNRTVYTFFGTPDVALNAAYASIETAYRLIDMRKHEGVHPRIGACDVLPFVPISNVSMDECVKLANDLAERIGSDLRVPVYLYAEAAKKEDRRSLAEVRRGQYESLKKRIAMPEFRPDCGPAEFNEKFGATAIGARRVLIAYNVNLNTSDVSVAKRIAWKIRESGNTKKSIIGMFKGVQAKGWFIDEYGFSQVSMNILNMNKAPLHDVFEACCDEAKALGAKVTGSEVIGMMPKDALLKAGHHFLQKDGFSDNLAETDAMEYAVEKLGLSQIRRFDLQKRIIEFAIGCKIDI